MKDHEGVFPEAAPVTERGVSTPSAKPPGGKIILAVPVLLVAVTYLFWRQTWFGGTLTDRETQRYLTDTSVPHKTQHALAQLSDRMARGDTTATRWYPQVLSLAAARQTQFRSMAAWVMGQDRRSEDFHQALLKLLLDPEPTVRSNAALALTRFGDASAEPELRQMLRPYVLVAPSGGIISFRLKEGDAASEGSIVARIQTQNRSLTGAGDRPASEVRAGAAGQVERQRVKDGAAVRAGEAIAAISPREDQVWESLRALVLVGKREDLADVERFAQGVPGMSDRVRQQATLTLEAIRKRGPAGGTVNE